MFLRLDLHMQSQALELTRQQKNSDGAWLLPQGRAWAAVAAGPSLSHLRPPAGAGALPEPDPEQAGAIMPAVAAGRSPVKFGPPEPRRRPPQSRARLN